MPELLVLGVWKDDDDTLMGSGLFKRVNQLVGLLLFGFEGTAVSYLLPTPIIRGPFGPELVRTLLAWGIAIVSLVVWGMLIRKESRERRQGNVPPFSGETPRLAMLILFLGAILGSVMAVVLRL